MAWCIAIELSSVAVALPVAGTWAFETLLPIMRYVCTFFYQMWSYESIDH